jgi:hypothetical protein
MQNSKKKNFFCLLCLASLVSGDGLYTGKLVIKSKNNQVIINFISEVISIKL